MGQGYCSGVVWGVATTENDHPLFAPRTQDLRTIDPGSDWFLWEKAYDAGIRHGRDEWDDGGEIHWCGAIVAADPNGATAWDCGVIQSCAFADFERVHHTQIAAAMERWQRFREFCRTRADYDPGEGVLRFVRWYH